MIALAVASEYELRRFTACPNGPRRPRLRLLYAKRELSTSHLDHGPLEGGLGLQLSAVLPVSEPTEAPKFLLSGSEALLGELECSFTRAPTLLERTSGRIAGHRRPRLHEGEFLLGRLRECSSESHRRFGPVERTQVMLSFEWIGREVETRLVARTRTGDVAPLAESALVTEKDEGAVDCCALSGVAGEGIGMVEMLDCVVGIDPS